MSQKLGDRSGRAWRTAASTPLFQGEFLIEVRDIGWAG